MTDQPWNQKFVDDGYCPYCGTINWERDIDFDWDNGRQECKCELCGAEWWEVLVPTPKSPSPVMEPPRILSEEADDMEYMQIHFFLKGVLDIYDWDVAKVEGEIIEMVIEERTYRGNCRQIIDQLCVDYRDRVNAHFAAEQEMREDAAYYETHTQQEYDALMTVRAEFPNCTIAKLEEIIARRKLPKHNWQEEGF